MALALAGLLGAIGLTALRSQIAEARLVESAARISSAVIRARAGATREDRIWRIVVLDNVLHVRAVGSDPMQAREVLRMPRGVRLSVNSGGTVHFYPDGHIENATFRLSNTAGERTVVLNHRGRVRLP